MIHIPYVDVTYIDVRGRTFTARYYRIRTNYANYMQVAQQDG